MTTEELAQLLPEDDVTFLVGKHPLARVYKAGDEVHVLLPAFPFPSVYNPTAADVLLRLPAGYPDARPDMFWTKPDVKLSGGAWPAASAHHEKPGTGVGSEIYTEPWQRWSRHTTQETWRSGIDGLRSFIGSIRRELDQGR